MDTGKRSMAVKVIKGILDILWYVGIAITIIGVPTWFIISSNIGALICATEINLDPQAAQFEVESRTSGSSLLIKDHHSLEPEMDIHGHIILRSPNVLYAILFMGIVFVDLALMLAILYLLRKLFSGLKQGSSFTAESVGYIRKVGLLIFLGTLGEYMLEFSLLHYFDTLVVTSGLKIRLGFHPPYETLFFGLVMMAIAEWFRHGVELEEEKALTV